MHLSCDTVICVLASRGIRAERIIARDNISREAAEARISKQKDDSFYISASDFTVYNDGSLESLSQKADDIAEAIRLRKDA